MSLLYQDFSTLETIGSEGLQTNQRITLITAQGLVNTTLGAWGDFFSTPLVQRLEQLEASVNGSPIPSIWPVAKTLTLTGAVSGSARVDGSTDIQLLTNIEDGTLTTAKVIGLEDRLRSHSNLLNLAWTTGFSLGPYTTTYSGDLNALRGALFVQTNQLTQHKPALEGNDFTILTNGPQNYGNQLALRDREMWSRSQSEGVWSQWFQHWTTANLDPNVLLLKTDVALAANKLANARSFSLTGVITANPVAFDGTRNLVLSTSIADGTLSIATISGLKNTLESKFALRGKLDNTVDLNTVTTFGLYESTDAFTRGSLNYPVNNADSGRGILEVIPTSLGILQRYRTVKDAFYFRSYALSTGLWSNWTALVTGNNLATLVNNKLDLGGGTIKGDLFVEGNLSSTLFQTKKYFEVTETLSDTNRYLFKSNQFVIREWSDRIDFKASSTDTPVGVGALSLTTDRRLLFDNRVVWHSGNLDPANPVPANGLFYVGSPEGTHLRLRSDGKYSSDAGVTWHEFNEIPQVVTDPIYNSLGLGNQLIQLSQSDGESTLQLRTGANGKPKYFSFGTDGNFHVLNGRVFVQGEEVWSSGNFDPTSKLNVDGVAASASKLSRARTINGVPFDGTQNITITAQATNVPWQNVTSSPEVLKTLGNLSHATGWLKNDGNGLLSWSVLSKSDLGLSKVDNTPDAQKTVASASTLVTARKINGTNFDGSVDVTTTSWGTGRNLSVGNATKNIDGSSDMSFSLSEIGAQANLGYTPLNKAGDQAIGPLSAQRFSTGWDSGDEGSFSCSNWFRSSGQTGILFNDYGGGLYMTDTTYVRVYGGKALWVDNDIHASAFTETSDARLKTSVDDLKAIEPLRPVSYIRIATGEREIGFIAQEVQSHYPEAVTVETDGMLGVKYTRLTAILAAQVNDVNHRMATSEETIADLQQQVRDLLKQLADLQAIVLKSKVS